ncbi:hypothetical protein L1887_58864 [Cichorium endivia]|nr:hypothetical protein L1887_58864 [Cichorium endivia]
MGSRSKRPRLGCWGGRVAWMERFPLRLVGKISKGSSARHFFPLEHHVSLAAASHHGELTRRHSKRPLSGVAELRISAPNTALILRPKLRAHEIWATRNASRVMRSRCENPQLTLLPQRRTSQGSSVTLRLRSGAAAAYTCKARSFILVFHTASLPPASAFAATPSLLSFSKRTALSRFRSAPRLFRPAEREGAAKLSGQPRFRGAFNLTAAQSGLEQRLACLWHRPSTQPLSTSRSSIAAGSSSRFVVVIKPSTSIPLQPWTCPGPFGRTSTPQGRRGTHPRGSRTSRPACQRLHQSRIFHTDDRLPQMVRSETIFIDDEDDESAFADRSNDRENHGRKTASFTKKAPRRRHLVRRCAQEDAAQRCRSVPHQRDQQPAFRSTRSAACI